MNFIKVHFIGAFFALLTSPLGLVGWVTGFGAPDFGEELTPLILLGIIVGLTVVGWLLPAINAICFDAAFQKLDMSRGKSGALGAAIGTTLLWLVGHIVAWQFGFDQSIAQTIVNIATGTLVWCVCLWLFTRPLFVGPR